MKKPIVLAVAIVASLALFAAPVSAGRPPGTVIVTPGQVEVGGSVVITNAADVNSTCEPALYVTEGPSLTSVVDLEVDDPKGNLIVDEKVVPDTDGNWSFEVTGLTLVGEYTVYAHCEETGNQPQNTPAQVPNFAYSSAVFDVVETTPTTPTTAADAGTSPTSAAAAAMTTTPAYTG